MKRSFINHHSIELLTFFAAMRMREFFVRNFGGLKDRLDCLVIYNSVT